MPGIVASVADVYFWESAQVHWTDCGHCLSAAEKALDFILRKPYEPLTHALEPDLSNSIAG